VVVSDFKSDTKRPELRALLGRFPAGVAVVTVDVGGQRLGLTVGTLVGLSLDPPLVGFSISRQAALHELLREAGGCAISLLAADQDRLAEHFARGVPPIGMWHGVATEPGASGAPLLAGALGWLECAVREEVAVGTHTLFVCEVERVEHGVDAPPLVRVRGGFASA
jgi:flavin reductase (DIM6/NTAB) family NADH-FMN oxidoreductase RutF